MVHSLNKYKMVRSLALSVFVHHLVFPNIINEGSVNKLNIDDSRKIIPHLNSMIIITNTSRIGNNEDLEKNLGDLFYQSEFFGGKI